MTVAALLAVLTPAFAAPPPARIDKRDQDTAVAACSDFYRHANGSWLQGHPVPAGRRSYGLLDQLARAQVERELALVEALAADPAQSGRSLADFIASGLDEAAIEAVGREPLKPLFAQIDRITNAPKQVPGLLHALQARGLPVVFRTDVTLQDGDARVTVSAAGLGLPDREFYLREDADTRELLGNYRRYVEQLMALAGSADPTTDAAWVLDAEIRLARGWPAAGAPVAPLTDTPRNLARLHPRLDWRGFAKAHDLGSQRIVLADPAHVGELEALIGTAHPVQWRAWLKFRVAHLLAPFLDRQTVAVHDAFFNGVLRGDSAEPTRLERVRNATRRVLGRAFDEALLAAHLPAERRSAAEALLTAVRGQLRAGVERAAWVPDDARGGLLERLDRLAIEIAEPGAPDGTAGLKFDRRRYLDNVLLAAAARQRHRLAAVDDRSRTLPPLATPALAAQYDSRSNKLQLGLGVLQAPLFEPARDPAASFGALGALIAHELTHAVDLAGEAWAERPVDNGRSVAFREHTARLVAQYDAFRALGQPVDGTRTLAENAADLAGLELAWQAFAARHDLRLPEQDGRTPAQRFFLGWAQLWRRNYRDEELLRVLRSDLQPPAEFRVNGPLVHMAAFADAFGCKDGQPMVRAGAERVVMFGVAGE